MSINKILKNYFKQCLLYFPDNICQLQDINKDTEVIVYCYIKGDTYNYCTNNIYNYIKTHIKPLQSFFKTNSNISNGFFTINNTTYGVCNENAMFKGFCDKETLDIELYKFWWAITTSNLLFSTNVSFNDINKWYMDNQHLLNSLVLSSLYCTIKNFQKSSNDDSKVYTTNCYTIEESDKNIKYAIYSFLKQNQQKCIDFSVFNTVKDIINLEKNKLLSYTEIKPFVYKCYHEKSFEKIIKILNIYGSITDYKNLSADYLSHTKIISAILDKENFIFMKRYFKFIQNFESNNIFSLGDSLDKYNTVWNSINNNKPIKIIPMSGSQYYDYGSEEEKNRQLMKDDKNYPGIEQNVNYFYNNNPNFKLLVSKLQQGEKVLLTDFGHTGKAVITIVNIISKYVNDLSNLTFLSVIIYNDENESSKEGKYDYDDTSNEGNNYYKENVKKLVNSNFNVKYIRSLLDPYYTNSERNKSRCIPRYTWKMWKNTPDDVWKDNGIPNYYMCNVHKVLMMMMLCCQFKNENFYQIFE